MVLINVEKDPVISIWRPISYFGWSNIKYQSIIWRMYFIQITIQNYYKVCKWSGKVFIMVISTMRHYGVLAWQRLWINSIKRQWNQVVNIESSRKASYMEQTAHHDISHWNTSNPSTIYVCLPCRRFGWMYHMYLD